jgi:ribonucleoside-diphosphate reductase beta chain
MKRYSIIPIQYPTLWERYKTLEHQVWNAQEIDFSQDKFNDLSIREKEVLKIILAFFVVSDGLVNENLAENIKPQVEQAEAAYFYDFQIAQENVHNETYGLIIDSYYKDPVEREEMFSPIEHMDTVRRKAEWALKWINNDVPLEQKVFAFGIVENIYFAGLFAAVFYFRASEKLPGLIQANELICRDEGAHYEFANHYYKNFLEAIPNATMIEMVMSAYEVEKTFVEETLGTGLPGLTSEMMIQYIQFITDNFLESYGLPKQFNVTQPLEYMNKILMNTRSNFFEKKSGTYTKIQMSDKLFSDDF